MNTNSPVTGVTPPAGNSSARSQPCLGVSSLNSAGDVNTFVAGGFFAGES